MNEEKEKLVTVADVLEALENRPDKQENWSKLDDVEQWVAVFECLDSLEGLVAKQKQQLQEDLQELESTLKKPPEKCSVCGAELIIASAEFGKCTYVCSEAKPLEKATREAWQHYNDSRIEFFTDPVTRAEIKRIQELLGEK